MDSKVQKALTKFENKTATSVQLAEFIGFTPDQLQILTLVWEPYVNKPWIYLSCNIIVQWFPRYGKEFVEKNYIDFYKYTFFKLKINVDYKEIMYDDPLIKQYDESYFGSDITHDCDVIYIKYFAVTNICFRHLCMKYYSPIRDFYIKIEELHRFTKLYNQALQAHHLQLMKIQIETDSLSVSDIIDSPYAKDAYIDILGQYVLKLCDVIDKHNEDESDTMETD